MRARLRVRPVPDEDDDGQSECTIAAAAAAAVQRKSPAGERNAAPGRRWRARLQHCRPPRGAEKQRAGQSGARPRV